MANPVKIARLEATIQTIINNALVNEVKNKYARFATVTHVSLTKDVSVAKIYLDCLNRDEMDKVLENVRRVSGFLRTMIAKKLNLWQAPELRFVADESITYASKIEALLEQIKQEK